MRDLSQHTVIFFDGNCILCNRSVGLILKNDSGKEFLFASLQSDAAKNILLHYNLKNISPSSILLLAEDKVYDKSEAVLKICQKLDWPWRIFTLFKYLPKRFRDYMYDGIAKNRYRWFGKMDSCTLVFPEYKNRFLL